MPDDNAAVAEQQEETKTEETTVLVEEEDGDGKANSPDESGFSDAFSDALKGEGAGEKIEDKKPESSDSAKKDETDKPETKESQDEKVPETKTEDTLDDDKAAEQRGREILEADKKTKKEADEKADQEKKAAEEAVKAEADPVPLTEEQVSNFIGMIPPSELPDEIEIGNQSYNVKEYMKDYPEAQVVSGFVTQKILERLVNNGVLITAEQHNEKIADIEDRMYGLYFDFTVLQKVPDAMEIVETKEYKTWMEKTATKEDLALLGSDKPSDYILGLKRYIKGAPVASEAAKKEAAAKAKTEKELHDGIHSLTMRAKPSKDDLSASMEAGANEFSSAFKEAEDKAEKDGNR